MLVLIQTKLKFIATQHVAAELQPDVCQNELTSVAFVCCSLFSPLFEFLSVTKSSLLCYQQRAKLIFMLRQSVSLSLL